MYVYLIIYTFFIKRKSSPRAAFIYKKLVLMSIYCSFRAACAEASRAMGTLNGEQLT